MTYLLFCSLAVFVHAEFQPSVWEQMQTGAQTSVEGKIKNIEVQGSRATVEVVQNNGQVSKQNLDTCTVDGVNSKTRTPEETAAFTNQRLEVLREARRKGEKVRVSSTGPWSPCVTSVSTKSP